MTHPLTLIALLLVPALHAAQPPPVKISLAGEGDPGALQVNLAWKTGENSAAYLEGTVTNRTDRPLALEHIVLHVPWLDRASPPSLIAAGGTTMVWPVRVFAPGRDQPGASGTYLQARLGQSYRLAAFTTWNHFWSELDYADGELRVRIEGERRLIRAGESVPLETIRFTEGRDWQQQLFDYADEIARTRRISLKPRPTFVGWSTWDYFGRTWTARHVRDNLATLQAIEPAANLVQIDGGWWPSRGDYTTERENLRVAGGMRGLAQDIKQAGMMAGIHFDGGRGDSRSQIYRAHPDYFLHDDTGRLIGQRQRQAGEELQNIYFDYSHPGATDFLREACRLMRHEWGYQFVKIDFLWFNLDWAIRRATGLDPARNIVAHDRSTTSVERLHRGMQAFRAGMGADAWFLGCGAPFGPTYGYLDSLRTGYDIWPNLRQFRRNVTANAGMFYLHGRVVYNDADYQISRAAPDQDAALVPDPTKDAKNLSRAETELWGRYVGLFSLAKINSDHLPILRPERRAVFAETVALPACEQFVPIDFWDHGRAPEDACHVMLGEAAGAVYLAIFNWEDQPREYRFAGLGGSAPLARVVGEATESSDGSEKIIRLQGISSVVYRLPADVKFEVLRRELQLR